MPKKEQDIIQIFTMVAMKLTSQIVDFTYQEMKIGRLIFIVNYIGYKHRCKIRGKGITPHIKPSTATRQLDKLVNNLKLVERDLAQDDRRIVALRLTDLGEEVYQFHNKISEIRANMLVDKFTDDEIKTLRKGLEELLVIFS